MRLLCKPIRSCGDFVGPRASEHTERQIAIITLMPKRGGGREIETLFSNCQVSSHEDDSSNSILDRDTFPQKHTFNLNCGPLKGLFWRVSRCSCGPVESNFLSQSPSLSWQGPRVGIGATVRDRLVAVQMKSATATRK